MTPTAFLAYLPEFAGAVADDVQRALDKAAPCFNVVRWGSSYAEGIANLAAHFYVGDRARRARAAAVVDGGNITEKHVGSVGASFDSQILNKQATDPFMTTDYGRQYCFLRDKVGHGGWTAP